MENPKSKEFYRIKYNLLKDILGEVRDALSDFQELESHEEENAEDPDKGEMEDIGDSLCDAENYIENLLEATLPLLQAENKAREANEKP